MIRHLLIAMTAACVCVPVANGQFAASLQISQKSHLVGEAVMVTVAITNHTGQDQTFQNSGRFPWLSFIVKSSGGKTINTRAQSDFGPMRIGPGQTLAREVNLSNYFQLSDPGNFTVSAVIQPPNSTLEGSTTNRAFFTQSQGKLYWSQKVGFKKGSREYRLIHFKGDSSNQVYTQIQDGSSGQCVATYRLGEILMMRDPVTTVDRNQCMHVLFLTTPVMWIHYVIDPDGNVLNRQVHQRGALGDPQLVTLADGAVQVSNSVPIDLDEQAKKRSEIHRITDRPAGVDEF